MLYQKPQMELIKLMMNDVVTLSEGDENYNPPIDTDNPNGNPWEN